MSGAGAWARNRRADSPHRSTDDPARVVFRCSERDDHRTQHRPPHAARGLPPPARAARGSFLLESVDQGRLGRYSLVGCGYAPRLASRRRSGSTRRSSATSATTTSRSSSRPCRFRPTAPSPGEPLHRRRPLPSLRPRHRRGGGARAATRRGRAPARRDRPIRRAEPALAGERVRFPDQAEHERRVELAQGAHPRAATPSRSCSRSGRSGRRRVSRSPSTGRCGGSTLRRTSSCSSSAGSHSSARRPRRT